MDNNEFFLQEWQDFKRFEREEHSKILAKVDAVEVKIDKINQWRFTISGVNIAISFLVATFGAVLVSTLFSK